MLICAAGRHNRFPVAYARLCAVASVRISMSLSVMARAELPLGEPHCEAGVGADDGRHHDRPGRRPAPARAPRHDGPSLSSRAAISRNRCRNFSGIEGIAIRATCR